MPATNILKNHITTMIIEFPKKKVYWKGKVSIMVKMEDLKNGENKRYFLTITIVLAIGIACWIMFSGGIPDNGSGIDKARIELESTRTELEAARRELSESRAIVEELKRANRDIKREISESRTIVDQVGQSNHSIAGEINESRKFNNASGNLIEECKSILKTVRARGQARN